MRTFVCLLMAAMLAVGCMPAPKRHVKPTTTQRSSSGRRPAPSAQASKVAPSKPAPAPAPAPAQVAPQPATAAQPPTAGQPSPLVQTAPAGAASAYANAGAEDAPELNPNVYRLMPGDGIHIDVFNEPELTVNAGIDSSGSINYPLLGHIPAAGMTVREFEQRITEALRGDYLVSPSVRVSIQHYRPFFISGNVRRVGSFPYSPGLTVEKALLMAGGITEYGSTKKIYIQHQGATEDQKEKVNLDTPVKPGDTVLVEERLF